MTRAKFHPNDALAIMVDMRDELANAHRTNLTQWAAELREQNAAKWKAAALAMQNRNATGA